MKIIYEKVSKVADTLPYLTELMPEIPANTVINKVITGLGATTSEIKAQRHSILVEPPRAVIECKCKAEKHKKDNLLGVYKGVTSDAVYEHIDECLEKGRFIKILTTPESLPKVIKAIERAGMDWRKDFFWLGDEVQKFTTDVDYRSNLSVFFRYFFEVERKALVSATPLPMTDPRFEEQGFSEVVFQPDFDFSTPIHLITTNSVSAELASFIADHRGDGCPILVFCNSTDLIYAFIRSLGLKDDAAVFCSKKSVEKLKEATKFRKAYDVFDTKHMKDVNFFTSRFYTGFDLDLDVQPHVVLVTELYTADHTMFDPYADVVQIKGRVRGGIASLTHITNIRPKLRYRTPLEVHDYLTGCRTAYNAIKTLRDSEGNPMVREAFNEALLVQPYNKYLNLDGTTNHFMEDCTMADEMVRRLYTDPQLLVKAYEAQPYFTVQHTHSTYPVSDEFRFEVKRLGKPLYERQREIVAYLDQLDNCEDDQATVRELSEIDPFIVDAYFVLGRDKIEELKYNHRKLKMAMADCRYHSSSTAPRVISEICSHFRVGKWYPVDEIKEVIARIYKENGVKGGKKVTGTSITSYFEAEKKNETVDGRRRRGWTLVRSRFESM